MPDALLPTSAILLTYDALLAVKEELARLRATQPAGPDAPPRPDDPSSALIDPVERRAFLERALARAVVAHPGIDGYAVAAVGTLVEVDDGRRTCRYRIVLGVEPSDDGAGHAVSATSPVGAALMGRAVGDLATVALPDGRERRLRVLAIDAA